MKSHLILAIFVTQLGLCFALFRTESSSPIEVVGNKFFDSASGLQFFIRGIAYQRSRKPTDTFDATVEPSYIDLLANPTKCLKDLELLSELGVNVVRVYQVDPTQNHDVCMNAFAHHGIYVLVDLSEPQMSIPQKRPVWDLDLYERYTAVVDSMHGYTNVLGFIAGNEVFNSVGTSNAAAFVKASVRDIKAYISEKGYRQIPVGYAGADDTTTRLDAASYFVCDDGGTTGAVVDFYALNMFEWCGYMSYSTSGYKERTMEFSQMPVPVFFSEYGCNTIRPRPFTEIDLIYGSTMSHVWSGGLIYEFFQNENNYGLVEENAMGHLIKLEDFNVVKLRLVEALPQKAHRNTYVKGTPFDIHCPQISLSWNSLSVLPPLPEAGLCECLQATLSCVLTPYVKVDEDQLMDEVCDKTDCLDVTADALKGRYGKYSGCNVRQRALYALNKLWIEKGRVPNTCDFNKRAAFISDYHTASLETLLTSDSRNCEALLNPKPVNATESPTNADTIGDRTTGLMSLRSDAQRDPHWSYVFAGVLVISTIVLAM